jgi:hypothetical protein
VIALGTVALVVLILCAGYTAREIFAAALSGRALEEVRRANRDANK